MTVLITVFFFRQPVNGQNTGWKIPTSSVSNPNVITNEFGLQYSDDSWAQWSDYEDKASYGNYYFGIPYGSVIKRIELEVEGHTNGTRQLIFDLSWENGYVFGGFTTQNVTSSFEETETTYIIVGADDTWGRTWSTDEINNKFYVRIRENGGTGTVYVDLFRVRIYYSPISPFICTSNSTFTVPSGVSSITVEAWGGGAGGGMAEGINSGGGGGGAYTKGTISGLTYGEDVVINVGKGGTPGKDGNPSFVREISANGGLATSSATGGQGGAASSSSIQASYKGGNGGDGGDDITFTGGGGGGESAYPTGEGSLGLKPYITDGTSYYLGGKGGTGTLGGDGGNGAYSGSQNSLLNGGDGSVPGGGGGGGSSLNEAGSGADGQVIISWMQTCSTPSTPGPISGPVSVCANATGNIYSVSPKTGATSYNWSVPTGSTITGGSGTNTITVTFGSNSGNVSVSAVNECGTSASNSLPVTVNTTPSTPSLISGIISVCAGSPGNNYSIDPVSGATSYNWSVPSGASITLGAGTNAITVKFGSNSGEVGVSASNACGTSATSTTSVTVNSVPAAPGTISGLNSVCSGMTGIAYSVGEVPGATSYSWSVPTGATITEGNTTNSIKVSFGSNSGNVTVFASNWCGTGASSSLTVNVSAVPGMPGSITGNSTVCPNASGQTYSVNAVAGATSYNWSVPSDATITGGNNTNAITVTFGISPGTVGVSATNSCGTGLAKTLDVAINSSCRTGADDCFEPNNTTQYARPIDINVNITANILNSKDVDWFKFTATIGSYDIILTPGSGGAESFELYSPENRKLKPTTRGGITYNLSGGTYSIKITSRLRSASPCYSLKVQFLNSLTFVNEAYDDLKSAVIELTENGNCSIWPNPARDEFRLYNGYPSTVRVLISDVLGRTMETIENVSPEKTIVFGNAYKPGIYIVETSGDEIRQVTKVVKQQ